MWRQMATNLQDFFPPSGNGGILFLGSRPEQLLSQLSNQLRCRVGNVNTEMSEKLKKISTIGNCKSVSFPEYPGINKGRWSTGPHTYQKGRAWSGVGRSGSTLSQWPQDGGVQDPVRRKQGKKQDFRWADDFPPGSAWENPMADSPGEKEDLGLTPPSLGLSWQENNQTWSLHGWTWFWWFQHENKACKM